MNQKLTQRIIEIDLIRGLAVIGMVIYHFFFALYFLQLYNVQILSGGWLLLARFVQFSFLTLVGVSLTLSFKKNQQRHQKFTTYYGRHLQRGLIILLFGILVTGVTTFFVPDFSIKFGILHLIGTGIIIAAPFAPHRYLSLLIGLFILAITPFITSLTSELKFLYPTGIQIIKIGDALDYFPIFPWLSLIFFGIFLGNTLYSKNKSLLPKKFQLPKPLIKFIIFNSKNALIIYLLHVPIIIALILYGAILYTEIIK